MSADLRMCAFLEQKRWLASQCVAPNRAETMSPYPQFTKQQLDMRRKVNILQYADDNVKIQSKLTKAQAWSQMANGTKFIKIPQSQAAECEVADLKVPSWTTESDVPGRPKQLYLEPGVPLYK